MTKDEDIKKDTSKYCDNLRNKDNPMYHQGCKLGNATSSLWCENEGRCCDFKNQMVISND